MEKEIKLLKKEIINKDIILNDYNNKLEKSRIEEYVKNMVNNNIHEDVIYNIIKNNKKEVNNKSVTEGNVVNSKIEIENIKQDTQNEKIVNDIVLKIDSEDNIKEINTTQACIVSENKNNDDNDISKIDLKNKTTKNCGIEDKYCKIYGYEDVNNEKVKIDITKELYNSIKMYSNIYIQIKDKHKNDIMDWLIKNRHIKYNKNNDKNRYRVLNKYKRSYEIYKKFNKNLKYVYFSFGKMTYIPKNKWENWIDILSNKIKHYSKYNCEFNENYEIDDKQNIIEDIKEDKIIEYNDAGTLIPIKELSNIKAKIINSKEEIPSTPMPNVTNFNKYLTLNENKTEEPEINYNNNEESTDESDDDKYINCIKCKVFIPEIVKDKLCYRCNSTDEYWN